MVEDRAAERILKRQKQLEDVRNPWDQLRKDIAEHVAPLRDVDDHESGQEGKRQATKIYDGTGMTALQQFSDGLYGYLVSPAIVWFRLMMANPFLNEHAPIRAWLQDTQHYLYAAFQRSNFYSEMPLLFEDAGGFGTAILYGEEDEGRDRANFLTCHPDDVWIAEDQYGVVDTVHRKAWMMGHEIELKFDLDSLTPTMKRAIEQNPYTRHEILHSVRPRPDRTASKLDNKNMPFASHWVDVKGKKILHESGYRNMPYHVWRYKKATREVYGRSPAMFALCDIMGADQIAKTLLKAAHLAGDPAYNVPAEMMGKVRVSPHGMNYYGDDHQRIVSPVVTGINYPVGTDREDRKREAIEQHFHVDLFLMLQRRTQRMTATEILERQGERATMLGVPIGRLTVEVLNPIMDLMFDIEYSNGRLPLLPPELERFITEPINVDYLGPLHQAQRKFWRTQGITQGLEHLVPLAQLYPQVLDIVDPDEIARDMLESDNFPQRAIRDVNSVGQIREARAQEMQQQQQRESLAMGAETSKTIAEADRASGGKLGQVLAGNAGQEAEAPA